MRIPAIAAGLVLTIGLLSAPAHLQQIQKGGEDETGPYDVVAKWPQPWAKQGYIWGSQPGVFAETPDRIFLAVRGELKLPEKLGRGYNGIWGSLGERATVPTAEMRNCLLVVDRNGKVVEAWTQWDKLFEGSGGPHKVKISPFDPDRHVWVVNDSMHQIYKFTNDGKQLVMTLGERGVQGEDDTHFGTPQDIAFLPDGSLVIADGLRNSRVVKLDRNGRFIKAWGTQGDGPGQFRGLHGIEATKSGRIYVADRGNRRIQVFDGEGNLLRVMTIDVPYDPDAQPAIGGKPDVQKLIKSGAVLTQTPGAPWALCITPPPNQVLYVSDSYPGRIYKLTLDGKVQGWLGGSGKVLKKFGWIHEIACPSENELYVAELLNWRTQKLVLHPR